MQTHKVTSDGLSNLVFFFVIDRLNTYCVFISLASKLAHWKTIRLAETQTKFLEHCMNKVHRFLHVNFTILAGKVITISLLTP